MPRQRIPSIRTLQAFERVAVSGGVTRAAHELGTSQSAISRHIKLLEQELGVALITRSGRGIVLTPEGRTYWDDIAPALRALRQASARLIRSSNDLTIACTHEVSHLLLMPQFAELRRALRKDAHVRILTCEYDAIPAMVDAGADIIFEYRKSAPEREASVILREAIMPVATPEFVRMNSRLLNKPSDQWRGIRRLTLTKSNSGWATWEDWFAHQGGEPPRAPIETFDNYVYALEAATRDEGIVLAWHGFADHYLATRSLTPIADDWLDCGSKLYACLTVHGSANQHAKRCLRFLEVKFRNES